jgi:hypothetical protein
MLLAMCMMMGMGPLIWMMMTIPTLLPMTDAGRDADSNADREC